MKNAPHIVVDTSVHPNKAQFIQGAVKFPVDHTNIWKTLGAGRFIDDGAAFDRLNDTIIVRWAEENDLPTVPFNREKLRPILIGVLQNTFYSDIEGEVPESCVVNQQKRVAKYLNELGIEAAAPPKPKKEHPAHFKAGPQRVYRLHPKLKIKIADLGGQQAILFKWFVDNKQGHRAQIAQSMEDAGFRANQPTDRVVSHYLNLWSKKGWLEEVVAGQEAAKPKARAKAAVA